MDRKTEKIKNIFFGTFDPFFDISVVLPQIFNNIIIATAIRWIIKVRTLDAKFDTVIKTLGVSEIVRF